MSKNKLRIKKIFARKGFNIDINKQNGQYNIYKNGCLEGYISNLSNDCIYDFLSCYEL